MTKARPHRREAATGRPPRRVSVPAISESAAALLEWLPREARRPMIRHLPESQWETGQIGLPLIAEAMARGLSFAYEGIAEAQSLFELREHLKRRDGIRDAMDQAHREGIFGEFLQHYEAALARLSEPAVERELETIPGELQAGLYTALSISERRHRDSFAVDRMVAIGQILGAGAREMSWSAIRYGTKQGLFSGPSFGLGSGPPRHFELIDARHFSMLRRFREVPAAVARDWGFVHPLVRGFDMYLDQDPWVQSQGRDRIEAAVDEVRDFVLQPRH